MSHTQQWWKEGVVYQASRKVLWREGDRHELVIYPRSYADSKGQGEGDIPGIISKLDYLKQLGVDVVWISPFFKSPQFDNGYDIQDYQNVHEPYGKVSDVEDLIAGCHKRGMKVLFDLVINHTSSWHEWFKESRSSKDNPKRDWYIWRPPTYDENGVRHPPCNWRGCFGGSVWEWDELTQEYYLHYFVPEQPDLNWENPVMRKELYNNAIKFWLDKGCDGFRIDVANMYSKFIDFPDAPITDASTPWQPAGQFMCNGPRLHEFLKEIHSQVFVHYDCTQIGEMPNTPDIKEVLKFVAAEAKEFHMVIQFDLADLDRRKGKFHLMHQEWPLTNFKKITANYQQLTEAKYDAWAVTYLENHDQARSVPRYASDKPEHRVASAKMLATYLLTVSGTPIIYQGQEIGMINCPKSWPMSEYKDVQTINQWAEMQQVAADTHDPKLLEEGQFGIQMTSRDHARTPMQWSAEEQAGFSTADETWMRVMDSYKEINVADQQGDPKSTLEYYRKLIAFRKENKNLFPYGHFEMLDKENEKTIVYLKRADDGKVALVALNFTAEQQKFEFPSDVKGEFELVESLKFGEGKRGVLGAYEAQIYISK
ncbi:BZ3500_MvSof-1268-A1-R1_Chr2-3g05364 [Microbotryum saponariae]|uniref:BZ3500_MvSof-1268-A1-R1_Chr2-3g05364 protein n=1 Tax=Microbotryum saponariae TaxID=289078 RepID=A0A2X0KBE8_9BASI|nr:BZ3500_MvSof-1268-A1-R1_Chr2-3g05364 [Microbotryum saponariae]SDA01285.1 BZ3501_MvSof-1269-A2-R1_Chr2-2g05037 [Microbotryum saponariae]